MHSAGRLGKELTARIAEGRYPAATVTASDFRGLRKLRAAAGKRFSAGVVLYDGEASIGFGEGLFAVPIRALWELK